MPLSAKKKKKNRNRFLYNFSESLGHRWKNASDYNRCVVWPEMSPTRSQTRLIVLINYAEVLLSTKKHAAKKRDTTATEVVDLCSLMLIAEVQNDRSESYGNSRQISESLENGFIFLTRFTIFERGAWLDWKSCQRHLTVWQRYVLRGAN